MSSQESQAQNLKQLREWLSKHERLPPMPDSMLELFLSCRKDDLELAKRTIESYVDICSSMPELFSNRDPELPENQKHIPDVDYAVLPDRDPDGNVVIIYGVSSEGSSNFCINNFFKLSVMYLYVTAVELGRVPGYIIIADTDNIKMGHITDIKMDLVKKFLAYLQDAIPMNISKFHVVNTTTVSKMLYSMCKPFLSKGVVQKVVLHTSDLDDLHKTVPKNILPEEYGGDKESMKIFKKISDKKLLSRRDILLEEEKVRIKKNK